MNKNTSQMNEMLFQKGINFNDYPAEFRRGVFVRKETVERVLTDAERAKIPEAQRPSPEHKVTRSKMVALDMPIFSHVSNRVDVIFNGAQPLMIEPDVVLGVAKPKP